MTPHLAFPTPQRAMGFHICPELVPSTGGQILSTGQGHNAGGKVLISHEAEPDSILGLYMVSGL